MIDSTKKGKGFLVTFIPCEELGYLITNRDVSQEFMESMDKTAVSLMLA